MRRCPLHTLRLLRPIFGYYLINHDRALELPVVPVKAFEQIDAVLHIVRPASFANAVHGQDGIAQIECSDTKLAGQHPSLISLYQMQSGHQDERLTAR